MRGGGSVFQPLALPTPLSSNKVVNAEFCSVVLNSEFLKLGGGFVGKAQERISTLCSLEGFRSLALQSRTSTMSWTGWLYLFWPV